MVITTHEPQTVQVVDLPAMWEDCLKAELKDKPFRPRYFPGCLCLTASEGDIFNGFNDIQQLWKTLIYAQHGSAGYYGFLYIKIGPGNRYYNKEDVHEQLKKAFDGKDKTYIEFLHVHPSEVCAVIRIPMKEEVRDWLC